MINQGGTEGRPSQATTCALKHQTQFVGAAFISPSSSSLSHLPANAQKHNPLLPSFLSVFVAAVKKRRSGSVISTGLRVIYVDDTDLQAPTVPQTPSGVTLVITRSHTAGSDRYRRLS